MLTIFEESKEQTVAFGLILRACTPNDLPRLDLHSGRYIRHREVGVEGCVFAVLDKDKGAKVRHGVHFSDSAVENRLDFGLGFRGDQDADVGR